MYGLIHTAIVATLGLIDKSKKDRETQLNKNASKALNLDYYMDYKGNLYSTKNDHPLFVSMTFSGDRVLEDLKTGKVIRNYTQERKVKEEFEVKQKAIASGEKIYMVRYNKIFPKYIEGNEYEDLLTGEHYVKRNIIFNYDGEIYTLPYYMNQKGFLIKEVWPSAFNQTIRDYAKELITVVNYEHNKLPIPNNSFDRQHYYYNRNSYNPFEYNNKFFQIAYSLF